MASHWPLIALWLAHAPSRWRGAGKGGNSGGSGEGGGEGGTRAKVITTSDQPELHQARQTLAPIGGDVESAKLMRAL